MKKEKNIKNMTKVVVILLLLLIIIIGGNIVRKSYIINRYIQRDKNNINSDNIYMKMIGENNYSEIFKKSNNYVLKRNTGDTIDIIYDNSDEKYTYIVNKDINENVISVIKTNKFDKPGVATSNFQDMNIFELLKIAYKSKITTEKNEKIECYKIVYGDICTYVNKENYMPVRIVNGDLDYSYIFSTDTVTDKDVEIPYFDESNIIDRTK